MSEKYNSVTVCDRPILKMSRCGKFVVLVGISVAADDPELQASLTADEAAIYVSVDHLIKDIAINRAMIKADEMFEGTQ